MIIDELRSRRIEGLAVSAISVGELYEGVFLSPPPRSSEAERVLTGFLRQVSVLVVNQEIGSVFGRERARLRQAGRPMSDLDLLIASTALHHDLTLLTSDRDFERMSNLRAIFL